MSFNAFLEYPIKIEKKMATKTNLSWKVRIRVRSILKERKKQQNLLSRSLLSGYSIFYDALTSSNNLQNLIISCPSDKLTTGLTQVYFYFVFLTVKFHKSPQNKSKTCAYFYFELVGLSTP